MSHERYNGAAAARALAELCLASLPDTRWAHVTAVGVAAEELAGKLGPHVIQAAWLHDIGYGEDQVETGFHAVDGARFLQRAGWDSSVVSLVAYHSGASFEAVERRLSRDLAEFKPPNLCDLDALTLIDMTTGPDGGRLPVSSRIAEILERYDGDTVVHRAVTAAQPELMASVARAARRLGLPDEGFGPPR